MGTGTLVSIRLRSKTLHELLANIFTRFIKRYYKPNSRKTYRLRGHVCKAVTARAVVASKKVVSDTIVFNHSADYIPRVVNILDPLFLAHTKDGSAGKAFIKGFHISLTLTRNVSITIPPDNELLYDITVKCRVALVSSKTLEENFRLH